MAIVDISSFLIHTEYYYTRDCEYCYTVVFSSLPVVRLINNALFGVDNFRSRGNHTEK